MTCILKKLIIRSIEIGMIKTV